MFGKRKVNGKKMVSVLLTVLIVGAMCLTVVPQTGCLDKYFSNIDELVLAIKLDRDSETGELDAEGMVSSASMKALGFADAEALQSLNQKGWDDYGNSISWTDYLTGWLSGNSKPYDAYRGLSMDAGGDVGENGMVCEYKGHYSKTGASMSDMVGNFDTGFGYSVMVWHINGVCSNREDNVLYYLKTGSEPVATFKSESHMINISNIVEDVAVDIVYYMNETARGRSIFGIGSGISIVGVVGLILTKLVSTWGDNFTGITDNETMAYAIATMIVMDYINGESTPDELRVLANLLSEVHRNELGITIVNTYAGASGEGEYVPLEMGEDEFTWTDASYPFWVWLGDAKNRYTGEIIGGHWEYNDPIWIKRDIDLKYVLHTTDVPKDVTYSVPTQVEVDKTVVDDGWGWVLPAEPPYKPVWYDGGLCRFDPSDKIVSTAYNATPPSTFVSSTDITNEVWSKSILFAHPTAGHMDYYYLLVTNAGKKVSDYGKISISVSFGLQPVLVNDVGVWDEFSRRSYTDVEDVVSVATLSGVPTTGYVRNTVVSSILGLFGGSSSVLTDCYPMLSYDAGWGESTDWIKGYMYDTSTETQRKAYDDVRDIVIECPALFPLTTAMLDDFNFYVNRDVRYYDWGQLATVKTSETVNFSVSFATSTEIYGIIGNATTSDWLDTPQYHTPSGRVSDAYEKMYRVINSYDAEYPSADDGRLVTVEDEGREVSVSGVICRMRMLTLGANQFFDVGTYMGQYGKEWSSEYCDAMDEEMKQKAEIRTAVDDAIAENNAEWWSKFNASEISNMDDVKDMITYWGGNVTDNITDFASALDSLNRTWAEQYNIMEDRVLETEKKYQDMLKDFASFIQYNVTNETIMNESVQQEIITQYQLAVDNLSTFKTEMMGMFALSGFELGYVDGQYQLIDAGYNAKIESNILAKLPMVNGVVLSVPNIVFSGSGITVPIHLEVSNSFYLNNNSGEVEICVYYKKSEVSWSAYTMGKRSLPVLRSYKTYAEDEGYTFYSSFMGNNTQYLTKTDGCDYKVQMTNITDGSYEFFVTATYYNAITNETREVRSAPPWGSVAVVVPFTFENGMSRYNQQTDVTDNNDVPEDEDDPTTKTENDVPKSMSYTLELTLRDKTTGEDVPVSAYVGSAKKTVTVSLGAQKTVKWVLFYEVKHNYDGKIVIKDKDGEIVKEMEIKDVNFDGSGKSATGESLGMEGLTENKDYYSF